MPQMSPINWTFMFLIFVTVFAMIAAKMYYYKEFNVSSSTAISENMKKMKMTWMW